MIGLMISIFMNSAQALEIGHLPDGWQFHEFKQGSMQSMVHNGAIGSMTLIENQWPEATILIFAVDAPKDLRSREDWRKLVINSAFKNKTSISHDYVDKQKRYQIEFLTDTGTQTMLNSLATAVHLDSKVYIFKYENDRRIYQKQKSQIENVFRQMSVK